MHHRLIAYAALAVVGLGAAPAALADPTQQAGIVNLRISIIDLDLNDGITPGISFASGGYIATWLSPPGATTPIDRIETPFPAGGEASAVRTDGSHTLVFTVVAGDVMGPGAEPFAVAAHLGMGPGGMSGEAQLLFTDFTLTPRTRIEVRASGFATTTAYTGTGGAFDAWAGAGVNLFSRTLQTSLGSDFINAYRNADGGAITEVSGPLFAAYDNASAAPFTATVSAVAYLGASEAAPVPEPAAWLLMAAGLLALPRLRRR